MVNSRSTSRIGEKSLEPQVHIVGPLTFQNELMAWYLQENTGLICACSKKLNVDSISDPPAEKTVLILMDCLGNNLNSLWSTIRSFYDSGHKGYYIALFNMATGQPFGNDLVKKGVRGIFYNNDPLPNLAKGVPAILNGELWYSRKDLMKCLLDSDTDSDFALESKGLLTSREKEILILIASGISNTQIAEQLSISRNTVKTHLYNIYNKIKVPNRLQAALWAAKHL
ncbi:MAG: response regulator transcription factor [Desulfobacterales bacterium]